jgi:hypothetical protein
MADNKAQDTTKWYELEGKIEKNVKLANDIGEKVKALGLRKPTVGIMGATLSDLCINLEEYIRLINQFLEANTEDRQKIGEILVEMRVCLDDVRWHCSHVKKALERVIDYCYDEDKK